MTAKRSRLDDERGAIMILALGFIAFIGVVAAVLAGYATTNLRATTSVRQSRAQQFSADAALDGAINAVRLNQGLVAPFTVSLTQQGIVHDLRVDWTSTMGPSPVTTQHVSFTACVNTGSPCSAAAASVATVDFDRSVVGATVPVRVTRWSVNK